MCDVCQRDPASSSKYYLFWQKATDLTYAVGFDANDRVTYSAVGDVMRAPNMPVRRTRRGWGCARASGSGASGGGTLRRRRIR